MTTHELARKLLEGPDVDVYVYEYGGSTLYNVDSDTPVVNRLQYKNNEEEEPSVPVVYINIVEY